MILPVHFIAISKVESLVKNLPTNVGDERDAGVIPGSGRCPGRGNGTLLWYTWLENCRVAWQATFHGMTKSQTWLNTSNVCVIHSPHLYFAAIVSFFQNIHQILQFFFFNTKMSMHFEVEIKRLNFYLRHIPINSFSKSSI